MKKVKLKLIMSILLKYHFATIQGLLVLVVDMSVVDILATVMSEENMDATDSFEHAWI